MDKAEIHSALNQLIEAQLDRTAAREELQRFRATRVPPAPPESFDGLDALVDFHRRKSQYDNELAGLESAPSVAEKAYSEAANTLRDLLPENVPLHYTYQGGRADLEGAHYTIVNTGGRIIIRWYRRPTSPP